jgi:hypothetical protein
MEGMNDPMSSDVSTSEHLTMQHVNQLKSAWKREHDDHMAEKDMNQRLNVNVNDLRAELEEACIRIEIERAKGELGVLSTCNVGKPDVLVNALTEILPALPKASICLSACIRVGDSWVCLEAVYDTLDDYKESGGAVTTYLDDMAHDLHRTKYYNLSQLDMNSSVTSELMHFIVSGYISRMEKTQEEVELTMNTSSFFILPVFSRCIWFLYVDPASSLRGNNNMSPMTSPTSATGSIRMNNSSFLSSPVPNIRINSNRSNNYSNSNSSNIYNTTGLSEEKMDSTMDFIDTAGPLMMSTIDLQSLLQLLEERAALLASGWFSILETTSQLVMSSFVQRLNQINMDRSVLVSKVLNHVNNHLFHVHNKPIASEPLSFTNCGLVAPSIHDAERLWSDLCPTLRDVAFQSYDLDFYFTVKYVNAQGQYSKLSLLSSSFTEAYELDDSDATVVSQVVAKGMPLFSQFPLDRREDDNIDIMQMEVDLGNDDGVQSIYAIPVFLPPVVEQDAKDGLVSIAVDDKNVLSFLGCVAVFRSKELKLSRVERENLLVAVQAVSSTMTAWLETHIQLFNPLYAPSQSGQPLHGRNRMQKSITGGTIADVTTGLSSTVRGVSFSSVGGSINLQQQSSVFLPTTSVHESIQQHAVSITSLMASVLQQCLEEGASGIMNKAVCLSACLRVLPAYLDADWVMPILIEQQNMGGESVSTYYLLASDGSGDRVPLPDVGNDLQSLIEWLVNAKVNPYASSGEADTNTVSLSAARIVEVMDLFEGGMYSSLFEDYSAHNTAPLDSMAREDVSFEKQKRKALYRILPSHVTPVFGARLDTCNSFHRNYDAKDKDTYGYDNSTSDVDSSILLITGRVFRGFDLEDMVSKMKEINQLLEIFNSIERTQSIFEMTKQVTKSFEERLEAMQYSVSIDHRINSAVSDFHTAMLTLDNHTREGIEKNVLQYHSIETLDTSTAIDGSQSEETKYDDEADAKYRIRHHGHLRSTLLHTISDFMVDLDKINNDVNAHKHPDTFQPIEGSGKEIAASVQLVMRENLNEEGESEMWVCDISTLLNNPIETNNSSGGHLYGGGSRHAHTAGVWQCLPEAQKNVMNISLLSHYAVKGHIIHKLHEERWTEGTPGCFSHIEVNAVDQSGDSMALNEDSSTNHNSKRGGNDESDLPTVTVWLVYKDPRLVGSTTATSSDTHTGLPSSTTAASHLIMSPQIQKVLRLHLLTFFDHFRSQICSYESSTLMLHASENTHRGAERIFDLDEHLFANSSLSTNTILMKNRKHGGASHAYGSGAVHHSHDMITGTSYSTGARMASSVIGKKSAAFDTIRQYAAREFHSSVRMLVKEDYLGSAFVLYELKHALPAFCCLPICIDYDLVEQKSLEVRDVRNNPLKPLGITERYLPAELSTSICEIVNHVIETGRTDLSDDTSTGKTKYTNKDSKRGQAKRDASNNNFYMLRDKAHAFLKHVRADGDKETGWYVPQGKSMYIPLQTEDVSTKSRVFLYLPDGLVTLTAGLNDPYLQPHGQDNPTYMEFAVPGFLVVPRCEACIHPGAFGDLSGFLEALMSPLTTHKDNSKYLHESILPNVSTPTIVNPGQGVMTTNAVAENSEILYLEKLLSDCCNECDYAWNRNHALQRGGFTSTGTTVQGGPKRLQTGTAAVVGSTAGDKGKFRYEQDGSRSINHVNMGAIGMLVLNWYNQSAHEVGAIQDYSKVGGLKCVRSAAYYLSVSEMLKHHYNEHGDIHFARHSKDSIDLELCSEKNDGLELEEADQSIEKSIAQSNTTTLLSSMQDQTNNTQNIYEGSFHAGAGYYTEDFFSEGMLTPTNYGNNTSMGINVLQSVGINVRTKTGAAISDELGHNHRWNDHVKIGCEYCPAPNAFRGNVSSRTKYGYLRIYIKMPRKWLMSPKAVDEEKNNDGESNKIDSGYTVIASIIFWLDSFVYAIPRGISVHLMNQARLAGNLLSAFVLEEMNAACARTVLGERLKRSSYRAMAQMSTLHGVFSTVLSAVNVANSGDTGDSAHSLGLGELPEILTGVQNAISGNSDDTSSIASSTLDAVNSGLDGDYLDTAGVDSKNGIAMDSHLGLNETRYMKETLDAVSAVCAALATTLRQVLDERSASSQARRKMAAITVKVRKEKSAAWSFIEQAARILLPSSYEYGYHGLISKSIYSNYHTGLSKEIDHLSHTHFNGNDIFDQQVCVFEPKVFNKFLMLMDIMSHVTGRLLNTCVTFSLREDASRLMIDSCNDKIYSQPYMKALMEDMPKNQKQILNQDVVIWCDHNAPPERLPHNNYLLRPNLLLTAWQKCAPVKALLETASRVNSDGHSEIIGQLVVEYMPVGAKNPDVVDISKTATAGEVGVTIGGKAYLPAQWEVNTQYPLAIIQYVSLISTANKVGKAKGYRSAGKGGDVRLRRHKKNLRKQMSRGTFAMSDDESEASDAESDDNSGMDSVSDIQGNATTVDESTEHEEMVHLIQEWAMNNFKKMQLPQLIALPDDNSVEGEEEENGEGMYGHQHTHEYAVSRTLEALLERCEEPYDVGLLHDPTHISRSKHDGEVHNIHFADAWMNFSTAASAYFASKMRGDSTFMYPFHQMYDDEDEEELEMKERMEKGMEQQLLGVRTRWKIKQVDHYKSSVLHKNEFNTESVEKLEDGVVIISREKLHHIHIEAKKRGQIHYFDDDGIEVFGPMEMHHVFTDEPESHLLGVSFRITGNTSGVNAHAGDEKYLSEMAPIQWMIVIQIDRIVNREDIFTAHSVTLLLQKLITQRILKAKYDKIFSMTQHLHSNLSIRDKTSEQLRDMWRFYDDMHKSIRMCVWDTGRAMRILYDGVSGQLPHLIGSFSAEVLCAEDLLSEMEDVMLNSGKKKKKSRSSKKMDKSDEDFIRQCVIKDRMIEENPLEAANKSRAASPIKGAHPAHAEEHHYSYGHHTDQHHHDASGAEHIRRKQHGRKLIFWIPLFKTSSHRTLTNPHASTQDAKCYWALKVLVEPHTPLANALKTDEGLNEKFNQFLEDEAKNNASSNNNDPAAAVLVKETSFANASEAAAAIKTAEASAANTQQAPVSSVGEENHSHHHGHHHHVHSIVDKSYDEAHGNVHFENLCFAIKAIRSDLTIISLERAVQNDARLQLFYKKVDGTIDSSMQSFALMLHNGDDNSEEVASKTDKRAYVSWNDMGETNFSAEEVRHSHESPREMSSSSKEKQVAGGELLDTMSKFSVALNESMYISDQATRLRWDDCVKDVFKDNNAFSGVSGNDSQAFAKANNSAGSVPSASSPSKPGAPGTPDHAAHDHSNTPYMAASDIAEQNTFRDDLCSLRARLHWVEKDTWQTTQYAEEIEKERLFRKMQKMQKRKLQAAQLSGAGNVGVNVGGNDLDVQAFLNADSDDEDNDDDTSSVLSSSKKSKRSTKKSGSSLKKRCERLQTPSNLSQSFLEEVIQSNSVQQQTLMKLHPSASNIRISRVRSSRNCKPLEYVLKKNKKRLQELGLDDGSDGEYSSSDSDSGTDSGEDDFDDATNEFEHDHWVAHVYLDVGVVGQKAVLEVLVSFCPLYLYPMSQLTGQYGYTHEVESYVRQCIFNSCQEGALMGLRIYMCNSIQLLHKTKHSAGTYDVLNEAIFLARSQSRVLGQALGELCRDEKFNAVSSEGIKEAVNDYFLYMLDRVSSQLMHLNGVLGITLAVWDTTRNVELYKKRACMSNDGVPIVQDLNRDVTVNDNPQAHFVDDTLLGYSSEYTFECGEISGVMAFFWDKHDPFNIDLPQINEKSHSQAALSLQEHKHTHHDDTSALISAFVKALSRRIFELYRGHRNSQLLAIQQKTIINVKADITMKTKQLDEALRKFEAAAAANDDLASKVDGLKSQLRVERQINAEAIHSRNSMADKAMKITAAMRAEHAKEVNELKEVYVQEHEAMAVDIGQRDAVINVLREEEAKLYRDNVETRKALSSTKKQSQKQVASIKKSIEEGDVETIQHILFSDNDAEEVMQAPPPSIKMPSKKLSQREPVDKDTMFHVTTAEGEGEGVHHHYHHHHSHRSHRSHKSTKTGAPETLDDSDIAHLPSYASKSGKEAATAVARYAQVQGSSKRVPAQSTRSVGDVGAPSLKYDDDDDLRHLPDFAGKSARQSRRDHQLAQQSHVSFGAQPSMKTDRSVKRAGQSTGAPEVYSSDDEHLPDFAGTSARQSRRAHQVAQQQTRGVSFAQPSIKTGYSVKSPSQTQHTT